MPKDKGITRIRGTHEAVVKRRIRILVMPLSITRCNETAKKFLYKTFSHDTLRQNKIKR